jgi:Xaa-Pro aminopeptidase
VKTLGEPYASRLVSAERLVSDFRSRRVASEIVAFGEAAGIAIQLAERALSNEVITPGQDHARGRRLVAAGPAARARASAPSSTCRRSTSPAPRASSPPRRPPRIQPGDVIMIDWGVQLMNFGTDVKRVAYVLKPGETAPPKSIQAAFDKAARGPRRR